MQSFDSDEDDIGSGDRGSVVPHMDGLDDPGNDLAILGSRKKAGSLRKAPQAPKRFKSSYILFFMAKQQEIKNSIGPNAGVSTELRSQVPFSFTRLTNHHLTRRPLLQNR